MVANIADQYIALIVLRHKGHLYQTAAKWVNSCVIVYTRIRISRCSSLKIITIICQANTLIRLRRCTEHHLLIMKTAVSKIKYNLAAENALIFFQIHCRSRSAGF